MYPPSAGLNLDVEAVSGICGSISIACWVVVFSPQIIENFRRSSADGLSVVFIVVWLAGDIFNILGAVLQGVLPTMIILAIYYTLADIVLLLQCFFYKGFTLKDKVIKPVCPSDPEPATATESSSLLPPLNGNGSPNGHSISDYARRSSSTSFTDRLLATTTDPTHLSPANPHVDRTRTRSPSALPSRRSSVSKSILLNTLAILLVVCAGVLGWWLSNRHRRYPDAPAHPEPLRFNPLGQALGYVCAVLYLASRVPQLLLNYRRKSTEGISLLFFLFACLGNLTYVLSIFAYAPVCERAGVGRCVEGEQARLYWRYIAINASWIIGSLGTLGLDAGVFVQYFMYRPDEDRGRR
ncbi:PQ loop repeat protein [Pseudovirgaria hyperparasitica]|uniref:PQ loop repeat protein n=1 Tax=Pseudovirgaria hyperparasitica TaxID=470096 RepID=A0A6A6VTN8_9PEZI|nr:PQ loop repeat protein [Pseudovirgaria hyperparasitica]KAF2753942.1 PQ loop repeat protein [Pseudovirgaria hyperparasitica]